MPSVDFQDLANFVNCTRTASVSTEPCDGKENRWALYEGAHRVHKASYPFFILYLYASASIDDIRTAISRSTSRPECHIVHPQSLEPKLATLALRVPKLSTILAQAYTTKNYLISYIDSELDAYRAKIAAQAPRDYADPHIETPSGFDFKYPNPVLEFLREPARSGWSGKLGIVLADPGQGKTYMSQYLVSRLSEIDSGLLPLLVDSSQWYSMSLDDQRSLMKTIAHSFRHFDATIGWLDGNEDRFLRSTLKAGVFRIVFDGFDEYILRNRGAVQPMDVLEALAELAQSTEARIVITSRTSFWSANFAGPEIGAFLERTKAAVFTILPFDPNNAQNYFKGKLGGGEELKTAIRIYNELHKFDKELVGRGFTLSLIADLAIGNKSSLEPAKARNPTVWLTEELCRREALRQELPLSAEEQLLMLRTFAVESAETGRAGDELVDFSIALAHPTLDPETSKATLEKLRSHPLISRDALTQQWFFKQQQVKILFLAEHLLNAKDAAIQTFVSRALLEPEAWQDLGAMTVAMVKRDKTLTGCEDRLRLLVGIMSRAVFVSSSRVSSDEDGSRLAGIVALRAVEVLMPSGSTHRDRAAVLLRVCGGRIEHIVFSETFERFDLSGVHFSHCRFESVSWSNCTFDEITEFSDCQFIGGSPAARCKGMGSARVSDTCRLDPEAESMFNRERIREGRKVYASADLRSDLESVIKRLIFRGGASFKSVAAETLEKGSISASRYKTEIIETVKNTLLEEHHISGASKPGFHFRKDAEEAVRFYAANNVYTGALREAFERLQEKIGLVKSE